MSESEKEPAENAEEKPQSVAEETTKDQGVVDTNNSDDWHDVECKIQSYEMIAGWIRFADTKAAVILTVSGAAAGFIIPTIHKVLVGEETHVIPYWKPIVLSLFSLYLFFFFLSNVAAFLCINPFRKKGSHPALGHCGHFHPAAIAAKYDIGEFKAFGEKCLDGGSELMRKEVQTAILFDAHISNVKYVRVKLSLRLFSVSVFFGFLYYLFAQL